MRALGLAVASTLTLALTMLASVDAHARPLPALDARVVDEAGVLDATERSRIDRLLASYEQRTGHQFAVVVLGSLEGDALESVSMRAAEQWRLGDAKRDDGAIVLLAMNERAARVEVGYGLEGTITDAVASRVIRDVMAPHLVNGHVALALEDGLDVLMKAAEGESTGLAPTAPGVVREEPSWVTLLPVVLFVVVMVMNAMSRRRRGGYGTRVGGVTNALWWTSVLGSSLGAGRGGGFGGGGFGGGGGGFGGGGGGFGGGGASGRW
jgi:uncharacterized protein